MPPSNIFKHLKRVRELKTTAISFRKSFSSDSGYGENLESVQGFLLSGEELARLGRTFGMETKCGLSY